MVEGLSMKRGRHNPPQFLGRKIFLHGFRVYRFISAKRISGDDAIRYGFAHDSLQLDGQVDDGSGCEIALCPQVQVVFVDEGTVQCGKRYVRQPVLPMQESFDMVVGITVRPQAAFRAADSYAFFKITDELPE